MPTQHLNSFFTGKLKILITLTETEIVGQLPALPMRLLAAPLKILRAIRWIYAYSNTHPSATATATPRSTSTLSGRWTPTPRPRLTQAIHP
jgi:hypothetical protein